MKLDAKPPGYYEAMQALADTLPAPEMTRAEALEKHRECMRKVHGPVEDHDVEGRIAKRDPSRACTWWLRKAYPEPEHARRQDADSLWVPRTPTMTREVADRRLLEGFRETYPQRAPAPR